MNNLSNCTEIQKFEWSRRNFFKRSLLIAMLISILASSPLSFGEEGVLKDFLKNKDNTESRRDIKTNEEPFQVTVELDREDRTYVPGETFQIKIQSERPGYLYIGNISKEGKNIIFPNQFANGEFQIDGGVKYIFPSEDASFKWKVNDELGTEQIVALVSERPLGLSTAGTKNADHEDLLFSANKVSVIPNFAIAQGSVQFNIVKERKESERPSNNPKRIAILFSVTHTATKDGKKEKDKNYQYRIGNLIIITTLLKQYGNFSDIYYLAQENMIKDKVKAAFNTLAKETNEGDEIFIYWEGHGGTGIYDESSTESDKKHEYLCLYDADCNSKDGYILDDEFAGIISVLKGRRVMMLIETCHSGGLLESATSRSMNNNFPKIEDINKYCNGKVNFSKEISQIKNVIDYSDLKSENEPIKLEDFLGSDNKEKENKSGKKTSSLSDFFKSLPEDTNGNLFLANFQSRLKTIYKNDISPDTPNLGIIFSSSKHESSYCAMIDADGKMVTISDTQGNKQAIGAPTYSLFVALTDTKGEYIKDKSKTTLEDVWNIAQIVIPSNAKRISQLSEKDRGATQVPVYMNTIPDVCVRPDAQ